MRERRSDLPQRGECALDTATGFQRTAMFQTLSGSEQLDGEHVFRKVDNCPQFQRARHTHGHVVFFSARRRDVIDAGWMREHARFVYQRRGCDMRES